MQRILKLLFAAALAAPLAAPAAFAHAFLDHGVPGVGMTASAPSSNDKGPSLPI